MQNVVNATGPGAIAVGGDAINSIFVTGGVNQFFVGQYERLADAYLSPRSLYREIKLDEFTGRLWLLAAVDDFISTTECGYLVVEAEAGMGKTAFMAWLARERGYVHHFVRLMVDANDVGVALRSLCAQLIRAWNLQTYAVGGILPSNASRPDFFVDVLYDAAAARDTARPGEPIVLVIDGINETVAPPGQNPLALPAELPAGVYVIVSQRTTQVPLSVTTARRVIPITADSSENHADIREYVQLAAAAPELSRQLVEAGMSSEEFVEKLTEWSNGVWLVLRYVLAELRSGVRSVSNIDGLPAGLWQYYARFWLDWQRAHQDSWLDRDLPMLATITAVQEPAPIEMLCELSQCADPARAVFLLDDAWRPFLQVHEDTQYRYRPFHNTLIEFAGGQVDPAALTATERSFVKRLADAQRSAHKRIAEHYLAAWGGVDGALPGLNGETAAMDGGYGLRHVVAHLGHASEDTVVHRLMELERSRSELLDAAETSQAANSWYEAHRARRGFANYALDIERAWSFAEKSVATGLSAQRVIALEFRYALMAASVNSITGNIPGELLVHLIDDELLTAAQGLKLIHDLTDPQLRVEALTALLPRLSGELRAKAQRDALSSVGAIADEYWRTGQIVELIDVLDAEHLGQIEILADTLPDPYWRDIVRLYLAKRRGEPAPPSTADSLLARIEPQGPEKFTALYRGRTDKAVSTLLAGIGSSVGNPGEDPTDFIVASRSITNPRWRAQVLVALAHTAPTAAHDDLLRAALTIALTVGDHRALASAIGSIAAHIATLADLTAAVACIDALQDPEGKARAYFRMAETCDASMRLDAANAALSSLEGTGDTTTRDRLIADNAMLLGTIVDAERLDELLEVRPSLMSPTQEHPTWKAMDLVATGETVAALALTDTVQDPTARAVVLLRIAAALVTAQAPGTNGRDIVDEASSLLPAVADEAERWRLSVAVAAALLADGRVDGGLEVLGSVADDEVRAVGMCRLARRLPPTSIDGALAVAATIGDPVRRAQVLAALTPLVVEVGRPDAHQHLRATLHLLAAGTRAQLLQALPDLLPAVTAVSGRQGLLDLASAVIAVYRWWP